jgi:hypothetical protein
MAVSSAVLIEKLVKDIALSGPQGKYLIFNTSHCVTTSCLSEILED